MSKNPSQDKIEQIINLFKADKLIVFMPILPSGAFFSDNLLTLFFINFSLLSCVDKNSNLFYKNN